MGGYCLTDAAIAITVYQSIHSIKGVIIMAINEQSTDGKITPIKGENKGSGGFGVWGICETGHGVHGDSVTSRGVVGTSQKFHGVYGKSKDNVGVAGESDNMHGVLGDCHNPNGAGVFGTNNKGGDGVAGESQSGRAIHGRSETGDGILAQSKSGRGVVGISETFQGVFGQSTDNAGIVGESAKFHAVFGISHSSNNGGVIGINDAGGWGVVGRSESNTGISGESNTGVGVHGKGGRLAGFFEGDVEVTGDIRLTNADCAEDFDTADAASIEPGTVMVLGDDESLHQSSQSYDKRVAGVVSGAGKYKPGIVLDKQATNANRKPIALLGKVYCKVDASYDSIEVGDLLTTSPSLGHAMKATDHLKAFGAVIGKALRPLKDGQGLIPILIALQ